MKCNVTTSAGIGIEQMTSLQANYYAFSVMDGSITKFLVQRSVTCKM